MIIQVTQDDIDRGCREDANNCPVARAVARAVPDADRVSVDMCDISIWVRAGAGVVRIEVPTSDVVADWIEVFDTDPDGRVAFGTPEPEPFEFELGWSP